MWAHCLQQPKRVAFSAAALLIAIGLGLCNGLGQVDTFIRSGYATMAPTPPAADLVVVSIGAECVASAMPAGRELIGGDSIDPASATAWQAPKASTAAVVVHHTLLVGVGASGLLDARALMRTGQVQIDGGVEASAGIAAALLQGSPGVRIEPWHNALFTMGMTILLLAALWSQPPARAFMLCLVIVSLGLVTSFAVWRLAGLWVAPGALLLAGTPIFALLTYRLMGHLPPQRGLPWFAPMMAARLHTGGRVTPRQLLPNVSANGRSRRDMTRHGSWDATRDKAQDTSRVASPDLSPDGSRDARSMVAQGEDAEHQRELQSLRDLLMAAIESLPDVILVCRASGRVVIGNLAAVNYFGSTSVGLRNCSLVTLLVGLTPVDGSAWESASGNNFAFAQYQQGVECRDENGAELLFKCAPCASLSADSEGWIVSLVDVAALHEAERRRDDAMRFLSHDMRSPLTAILALLSLNREDATALPAEEMLSRIRRLASRSLALAEAFVQLARAQPPEHAREAVDLADIVMDAADDCWSQAQSKRIVIDVDVPPDAAQTLGDRELIRRAVINLVNNAVKFSPCSRRVVCAVSLVEEEWCIAVRDEGRGIAFEDREQLFKKFVRLGEHEPDAEPGVGLGLAFTKTVVDRHNGRIEVDSVLGVGSEFRLYLKVMAGTPGA